MDQARLVSMRAKARQFVTYRRVRGRYGAMGKYDRRALVLQLVEYRGWVDNSGALVWRKEQVLMSNVQRRLTPGLMAKFGAAWSHVIGSLHNKPIH